MLEAIRKPLHLTYLAYLQRFMKYLISIIIQIDSYTQEVRW